MEGVEVIHRRRKYGREKRMYGYNHHDSSSRIGSSNRKPPLGKKAPATHRKLVVEREGILEVISCDETEPVTVDGSHSWSLSSNSIMTTWLLEHDEDDPTWDGGGGGGIEASLTTSASNKSIQSFTSTRDKAFSPVYEVTAGEQKNIFQENHKPLPKPGRTPKFGNLSYGRDRMFGNLSYKSSSEAVEDNCPSIETRDRAMAEKTPKLGNLSRRVCDEGFTHAGAATTTSITVPMNESPTNHKPQKQQRKAVDPISISYFDEADDDNDNKSSPVNESPISPRHTRYGWPKRESPKKYLHEPMLKKSFLTTPTSSPRRLAGLFTDLTAPSTRTESFSPLKLRRQLSSHSTSSSSARAQAVLQSLDDDSESSTKDGISLREIRLHSSKAAKLDPPSRDRRKLIERQKRLSLRRGATPEEQRKMESLRRELHLRLGERNQQPRRAHKDGGDPPAPIGKIHRKSQPNDDAQREPTSASPIHWQEATVNDENNEFREAEFVKRNMSGSGSQEASWIEAAVAFSGSSSDLATRTRLDTAAIESSGGNEDKQYPTKYTTAKGPHGFVSRFEAARRNHVRKGSNISLSSTIEMKSLVDEDDSSINSIHDEETVQENKSKPKTNVSAPKACNTSSEVVDASKLQTMKKLPKPPTNKKQTIGREQTPMNKVQTKANKHALLHSKRRSSMPVQGSATNNAVQLLTSKTLEGYIRGEWRLSAGSTDAETGTEDWSQELGVLPESDICGEGLSKTSDFPAHAQKEKVDPNSGCSEEEQLEDAEDQTENCKVIDCEQETSVVKVVDTEASEEMKKSSYVDYTVEQKSGALSFDRKQDRSANQQAITGFRRLPPSFCGQMMQSSLQALCKVTVDAVLAPTLCCALDKTRSRSLEFSPLFDHGPMRCTVTLGEKKKDGGDDGERKLVARRSKDDFTLSYLFPTRRSSSESPTTLTNLPAPLQRSCVTVNGEAFRVLLGSWRHKQARKSITPTVASSSSKPTARKASVSPKAGRKSGRRKRSLSSDFASDLVQDTELRDMISNTNALFLDVSGSLSHPTTPHNSSSLCIDDEDDDRLVLDPKALALLTEEENEESSDKEDSVVGDTELRAVMKLTNDADDISALFPTFSYDSQCYCDSNDGLDRELGNLMASEVSLRKEMELAMTVDPTASPCFGSAMNTPAASTGFSVDTSMANLGEVNECEFSSDSSMADFEGVSSARSSLSPAADKELEEEDEDSTRRVVRFDDNIQEHIFENHSGDDPEWTKSGRWCSEEETFLDEIVGVFEDLIDELGTLCVTTSKALDRGSMVRPTTGKGKRASRSMAG